MCTFLKDIRISNHRQKPIRKKNNKKIKLDIILHTVVCLSNHTQTHNTKNKLGVLLYSIVCLFVCLYIFQITTQKKIQKNRCSSMFSRMLVCVVFFVCFYVCTCVYLSWCFWLDCSIYNLKILTQHLLSEFLKAVF